MECKDVADSLPEYLDRELGPDAVHRIEQHIASCKECRSLKDEFSRAWTALDVWNDDVPPEKIKKGIMAGIRSRPERMSLRWALPVAAALVLAAGFVIYSVIGPTGIPTPGGPAVHQAYSPGEVSDEEVIAYLDILEDEDFLEVVDELVKIDYLPLIDEPYGRGNERDNSLLEVRVS